MQYQIMQRVHRKDNSARAARTIGGMAHVRLGPEPLHLAFKVRCIECAAAAGHLDGHKSCNSVDNVHLRNDLRRFEHVIHRF